MLEQALDADQRLKLDETVEAINEGTRVLNEFCTSIRDSIVSRDSDIRRKALDELSYVVLHLDESTLIDAEAVHILDFLVQRLADSAHSSELLVSAVHRLIYVLKPDEEDIERVFHALFDDNSVQAYPQTDRIKLLDIFDLVITSHFKVLEKAGAQVYALFSNAAAGERDPRCLLKVFSIFVRIMEQLDLSILMEDMFELVACYYPIEYKPRSTDVNPLSREVLSAACEACLLANQRFSLYTYQLILEKLLEEEENVANETKLECCRFLEAACLKFGPASLTPLLDDFLAAYRMLALNPSNTQARDTKTGHIVGSSLKMLLHTLAKLPNNADVVLNRAATTMLENCEPFILQAEMGLSTKAFALLEQMADACPQLAEMVFPKVLYWLFALLTGLTTRNPANREEIEEETLEVAERWFKLAVKINKMQLVVSQLTPTFDAMKGASCGEAIKLRRLCSCGVHIMSTSVKLSEETRTCIETSVERAMQQLDELDTSLRDELLRYTSAYMTKFVERRDFWLAHLLEETSWHEAHCLRAAAVISAAPTGVEPLIRRFLDTAAASTESSSIMRYLLMSLRDSSKACDQAQQPLHAFVDLCLASKQTMEEQKLQATADFLQDLTLCFNDMQKADVIECCKHKLVMTLAADSANTQAIQLLAPVCILSKSLEVLQNCFSAISKLVVAESALFSQLTPFVCAFYFAIDNRGGQISIEKQPEELQWLLRVTSCRCLLLTSTRFPTSQVKEILENAPNNAIAELLLFDTRLTEPQRCDYARSFMWTQRIVSQMVIFIADIYGRNNETVDKLRRDTRKAAVTMLIAPLLRLAAQVPIAMTNDLKPMLAVIMDVLDETCATQQDAAQLLTAGAQLLALSDLDPQRADDLTLTVEQILMDADCSPSVAFAALEVLEVLTKRTAARFTHWESTLRALHKISRSTKRKLRQKAALVRNLWELTPA